MYSPFILFFSSGEHGFLRNETFYSVSKVKYDDGLLPCNNSRNVQSYKIYRNLHKMYLNWEEKCKW